MAAPAFTIKISNRDKSPRTFTNFKGEQETNKYQKIGVLFENRFGGYDLSLESKGPMTLDPTKVFISVFPNGPKKSSDEGSGNDGSGDSLPF